MNLEQTLTPEYISTTYSSPRDEVLHHLSLEGWANQSSGETASTTGYFARISNSEAELQELTTNFGVAIQSAGLADPSALIGHYLRVETDDGFVLKDDDAEPKKLEASAVLAHARDVKQLLTENLYGTTGYEQNSAAWRSPRAGAMHPRK